MTERPHPALPRKRGRENFVSRPDAHGRYGRYGGQFIPETLMAAVDELAAAFDAAQQDAGFRQEFDELSLLFIGHFESQRILEIRHDHTCCDLLG